MQWSWTFSLVCEVAMICVNRLTYTNSSTLHIILNFHYHNINIKKIIPIVAVWMNKQSYTLCGIVLTLAIIEYG